MLLQTSFNIATRLSAMAVKQLQRLNGLPGNIYFPIEKASLYNDSSQNYTYGSNPDESGVYLFTGIYGQEELTGLELEGYSSFNDGDGKMYVVGENISIPRNSKVECFYQSGMKVFRTQDTKIVNGNKGLPVYAIINIVPVA